MDAESVGYAVAEERCCVRNIGTAWTHECPITFNCVHKTMVCERYAARATNRQATYRRIPIHERHEAATHSQCVQKKRTHYVEFIRT